MDENILGSIALREVEFEMQTGRIPTIIYLGRTQLKSFKSRVPMPDANFVFVSGNRESRFEYKGKKLFEVIAEDFLGVGI